jgi:hypothetical protein
VTLQHIKEDCRHKTQSRKNSGLKNKTALQGPSSTSRKTKAKYISHINASIPCHDYTAAASS